jgi:hypothetical protein
MHSILLLTAVTATSGLFGGARHCKTGQCGTSYARPARVATAPASCQTGNCGTSYAPPVQAYAPAPRAYAPAPQMTAAPAAYSSYYTPAVAGSCATGNCPRR